MNAKKSSSSSLPAAASNCSKQMPQLSSTFTPYQTEACVWVCVVMGVGAGEGVGFGKRRRCDRGGGGVKGHATQPGLLGGQAGVDDRLEEGDGWMEGKWQNQEVIAAKEKIETNPTNSTTPLRSSVVGMVFKTVWSNSSRCPFFKRAYYTIDKLDGFSLVMSRWYRSQLRGGCRPFYLFNAAQ